MSLQEFITSVSGGGISRDNRFRVSGTAIMTEHQNLVQSVALPGIQFHTGLYRNVGAPTKYINNAVYNELSITFIDLEATPIQNYYREWIGQIYNELGQFQYKNDYVRTLKVEKLNRQGEVVNTYDFQGVFPTNVSDVALSQTSQNQPTQLTVTLSYDKWS